MERLDAEAARPASIAAEAAGSGRRIRLGAVVSWGRSASDADSSVWVSRLPRLFSLFFLSGYSDPCPTPFMQYSFFIILLYIMVAGLMAALALCFQVGYSVGGGRQC